MSCANIHRRHMTKGQRAMAVAMIYPEPEQGKSKTSVIITEVGFAASYLSHARTVLRHSPELARSGPPIASHPTVTPGASMSEIDHATRSDWTGQRRGAHPPEQDDAPAAIVGARTPEAA